jgi:hypothetical protein
MIKDLNEDSNKQINEVKNSIQDLDEKANSMEKTNGNVRIEQLNKSNKTLTGKYH